MTITRWRACYFTPQIYRKFLRKKIDKDREKNRIAQQKIQEKELKARTAAVMKTLGPAPRLLKNSLHVVTFCARDECNSRYAAPAMDEVDAWIGCEFCDGRWYCGDDTCKRSCALHEVKCRKAREESVKAKNALVSGRNEQARITALCQMATMQQCSSSSSDFLPDVAATGKAPTKHKSTRKSIKKGNVTKLPSCTGAHKK